MTAQRNKKLKKAVQKTLQKILDKQVSDNRIDEMCAGNIINYDGHDHKVVVGCLL